MSTLISQVIEETLEECYGFQGDEATKRLIELNKKQRLLDEPFDDLKEAA